MTLQQVVEAARQAFPVPGSDEIFLLKLVSGPEKGQLGGDFNFSFSPLFGEMIQFD